MNENGQEWVNLIQMTIMSGLPGGSAVKNLPAMQETQAWSLGQEGALQEGVATHSSMLAWRIPWTEEPGGLQFTGLQRDATEDWVHTTTFISITVD